MAKLLGVIRYGGKLGQTVGYRGANGKRLVRARVDEISNPRSTGQNIQRMIFSTAAVSLGHLSEVLRSSVEGVKAGAPSLAYLRGKALNMLRTSDIMEGNDFRYALKGASDFVVNPYQISKGSLAPVNIGSFSMSGSENALHLGISSLNIGSMKFSELFPNVALGDQITLVQVAVEIGTQRPAVFYCRFAAKTNDLPILVSDGSVAYHLNEAALDTTKCAGSWRNIEFVEGIGDMIIVYPTLQPTAFESDVDCAYGIIVSNRETGKRSTSFLQVASDIASVFPWNADVAAPTYGNGGTPVDVAYDEYCDNSTEVSEPQVPAGIEVVRVTNSTTGDAAPMVAGVFQLSAGAAYAVEFNKAVSAATLNIVQDGDGFSISSFPSYGVVNIAVDVTATGGCHFAFNEGNQHAVLGYCTIAG